MTPPVDDAASDVPDTDAGILTFRDGIPGFPEATRFVLVETVDDGVFQLLECVDDPALSMVVTVPWLFFPDYSPELSEIEQRELQIESEADAVVFCAVTLDGDADTAYANLLGPFVVNSRTREGRQLVLTDSGYPARAELTLPREA